MALLATIKATVNTRLADLWPKVKNRQATYFASKGRYWQGRLTSVPPDDGATVAPDLTTTAGPQNVSWQTAVNGDIPNPVECAVQIDTYEAPGGVHGYYCTCLVTKAGVTYGRTAQVEAGVEITTGSWAVV